MQLDEVFVMQIVTCHHHAITIAPDQKLHGIHGLIAWRIRAGDQRNTPVGPLIPRSMVLTGTAKRVRR